MFRLSKIRALCALAHAILFAAAECAASENARLYTGVTQPGSLTPALQWSTSHADRIGL
jgi:hypothetical protein